MNEGLLIYRSTPLAPGKKSPGELMFSRAIKTNLITFQTGTDNMTSCDDNAAPPPTNVPRFHTGDRVFVYNEILKLWERGRITGQSDQPNQFIVMLQNGHICRRNAMHLKPDNTSETLEMCIPSDSDHVTAPIDPRQGSQPTSDEKPLPVVHHEPAPVSSPDADNIPVRDTPQIPTEPRQMHHETLVDPRSATDKEPVQQPRRSAWTRKPVKRLDL